MKLDYYNSEYASYYFFLDAFGGRHLVGLLKQHRMYYADYFFCKENGYSAKEGIKFSFNSDTSW